MGPFSEIICIRAGFRVALATVLLLSCDEKQNETAPPTEPWLKEEAERKHDVAPSRIRYQLHPGASLTIALPTRRSKPTGRLTRVRGYVDFDVKELARSKGHIAVDLDSLEMNNLPRPEKAELEARAPELYSTATKEALEWLGLGEHVTAKERRQNGTAVFEFDSLRALSHPSARTGSLRKSKGPRHVRQVYATADGELSMRGLAVRRQFPTTLLFHFPDEQSQLPDNVEVTLRSGATIPLAEYEIVPRGPDGHENARRRDLIGEIVGSQVKVTGTLEFSRPGVSPTPESNEKP